MQVGTLGWKKNWENGEKKNLILILRVYMCRKVTPSSNYILKSVFDSFIKYVLDIIDLHLSTLSNFACLSSSSNPDFMSPFNQIY